MLKKVSEALKRVYQVSQENGCSIVQTHQITREDRELLLRTGSLQKIIKGWYLLVRLEVLPGDSTLWYASFWDFLRLYLSHKYGQEYCLSAENSLELLLDSSITPKQVVVIAKKAGGVTQSLPFDTSVLIYADSRNIPIEKTTMRGLQVMTLPYAICRITPSFFQKNPEEAQVALQSIRNPGDLLDIIVKYQFKRPAARLASAYRYLANEPMASAIENIIADFGDRLKEANPFHRPQTITSSRITSPYYGRILTLWNSMRDEIS